MELGPPTSALRRSLLLPPRLLGERGQRDGGAVGEEAGDGDGLVLEGAEGESPGDADDAEGRVVREECVQVGRGEFVGGVVPEGSAVRGGVPLQG